MARHKKVGRPKGKKASTICRKVKIYHKRKGRITKVSGYPKKSCLQ